MVGTHRNDFAPRYHHFFGTWQPTLFQVGMGWSLLATYGITVIGR